MLYKFLHRSDSLNEPSTLEIFSDATRSISLVKPSVLILHGVSWWVDRMMYRKKWAGHDNAQTIAEAAVAGYFYAVGIIHHDEWARFYDEALLVLARRK